MKKFLGIVRVSAALLAVFFCGSGVLFAAEIISIEGKVQVQSPSEVDWREAQKGMTVDIGDSIRTARHSKADIALDAEKKNTIQIGEKTLIVLNSASAGAIDRVDLSKGRVYANMEGIKEGLSFEVNTPSSVAGVRGSSYMVYAERDSDEVAAYKDTVFLKTYDADKNLTAETMLPEGFKTFIERFEAPGAFTQIAKREFDRFDTIKEDLTSQAEGREKTETGLTSGGTETSGDTGAPQGSSEAALEQAVEQSTEQGGVVQEVTDTKDNVDDQNTQQKLDETRITTTETTGGGHQMP